MWAALGLVVGTPEFGMTAESFDFVYGRRSALTYLPAPEHVIFARPRAKYEIPKRNQQAQNLCHH